MHRGRSKTKTRDLTVERVEAALKAHRSAYKAAIVEFEMHPATLSGWIKAQGLEVVLVPTLVPRRERS